MSLPSRIALVGFMGSGKSTVGPILATLLRYRFFDSDQEIEALAQARVGDIFKRQGEAFFRKLETETIKNLAAERDCVIATGGGAFIEPLSAEALLTNTFVVHLNCPFEEAFRRVAQLEGRPLVARGRLEALGLYTERKDKYSRAHLTVDAARRSPHDVAAQVLRLLPKDNGPAGHVCAI